MYKEKVVASYIVAVLSKQMLKDDEIDVLLALCEKDFQTNNPLIRRVKDMIRGSELSPNDPDFVNIVYNFVFNRIVAEDKDFQKFEAKFDELLSDMGIVSDIVEDVRVEVKPKHIILFSMVNHTFVVTEAVYLYGEIISQAQAVLSQKGFESYTKFVAKRATEKGLEVELRQV